MMGINAVKGVEIGDGFRAVEQRGSEHRDELTPSGFKSNHAGGVLGGISSGQDIVVSLALKPTSSITVPGATIDLEGNACEIATTGRHDPCVGFRATPIAEAMMALVLMDHYLRFRAQCADVVRGTPDHHAGAPVSEGARARAPRVAVVGATSLIGEAVIQELGARRVPVRRAARARRGAARRPARFAARSEPVRTSRPKTLRLSISRASIWCSSADARRSPSATPRRPPRMPG